MTKSRPAPPKPAPTAEPKGPGPKDSYNGHPPADGEAPATEPMETDAPMSAPEGDSMQTEQKKFDVLLYSCTDFNN